MRNKILSGLAGLALLVSGCETSTEQTVWEQQGKYMVPRVERTVECVETESKPLIINIKRGEMKIMQRGGHVKYLGMQKAIGTYDLADCAPCDGSLPLHYNVDEEVIEFDGCKYEPLEIRPHFIKLKVLGCK